MRPIRFTILVLAASVLAACGAVDQVLDEAQTAVDDIAEEAASAIDNIATTPPADDPAAQPTNPEDVTPEQGPVDDPASAPPSITPVADGGSVGASGPAILRGDRPRLVIEVDVQTGASVPQSALDHLAATVSSVSDKAEVVFSGGNEFESDDQSWSRADLDSATAANRTTASDATQVSLHLLVVRGVHERDGAETNAIGLAYSASTMAYFPDRVGGLTGLTGGGNGIARSVLVHELGHLLGLVNLTYDSPIDHEDPDQPGHSASENSVMFHAVETTLVTELFGGGPPDGFDDDDLADLAGLRSGELGG